MAIIRLCSIPECGKPVSGRGYCSTHYMRIRRRGTLELTKASPGDGAAFVEKALTSNTDECIVWPFLISWKGHYPRITKDGKRWAAHRYVCTVRHGPGAKGLEAAHSCGNHKCINPNHLRWATPLENTREKKLHGTQTRGEGHPATRHTEEAIREMKYARHIPRAELAKKHGTSVKYIGELRSGRHSWKHV